MKREIICSFIIAITAMICITSIGIGNETSDDAPLYVSIEGPDRVINNEINDYTIYCEHYMGNIYYRLTWGDGNTTDWFGSYNPYESIIIQHHYNKSGIYNVTVDARVGNSAKVISDELIITSGDTIIPREHILYVIGIIFASFFVYMLVFRKEPPPKYDK